MGKYVIMYFFLILNLINNKIMSITFYSMGEKCFFCMKAKELLKNEIESGEVIVIEAKDSPKNFPGFPAFMYKDKEHVGLPSSKVELYNKLGYRKENFMDVNYFMGVL